MYEIAKKNKEMVEKNQDQNIFSVLVIGIIIWSFKFKILIIINFPHSKFWCYAAFFKVISDKNDPVLSYDGIVWCHYYLRINQTDTYMHIY